MAYSDGGWTRTKPWACSSSPDRTGGCRAARPPAAAQSMRFCTSETGDEPCAVCAPETRRKSVLLATMNVCGGRACALGIRCDCVALQLAAAPSCWFQARAPTVNPTQGGLRDATEYLTGDPRRAAPGRRLQACRGRARLRCGRCDWQPRAGDWPLGARRRQRVACISACVPVQVLIPAADLISFKFGISRAVRVLKLDSEAALPRSLPGSGAWE